MDVREFHERYARALEFATRRHAGQTRKHHADVPYVVHPIRVAALCLEASTHLPTEERLHLAVVSLLHDTLEDTETTAEDLEQSFGKEIAGDVEQLSKPQDLPKEESDRRMIEQLEQATSTARFVKLADRLDNLTDARVAFEGKKLERYLATSSAVLRVCSSANPTLARALGAMIDDLS